MYNDIESLQALQQALLNRLNSLSVESPMISPNDNYSLIENEANKLSDYDKKDLLLDKTYLDLVGLLNAYILQELFRMIRTQLNLNQDAVLVMKKIADYITNFKCKNDNNKAELLDDFQKYISNYSNMSYDEYKKLNLKKHESDTVQAGSSKLF